MFDRIWKMIFAWIALTGLVFLLVRLMTNLDGPSMVIALFISWIAMGKVVKALCAIYLDKSEAEGLNTAMSVIDAASYCAIGLLTLLMWTTDYVPTR